MPKVLVVDDSPDVLELVGTVLALKDFDVLKAENGREGLRIANEVKPDVILLDLMLPDIDGIQVCQTLKSNPETKSIPIIILTARTSVLDRIKGLEIGGNDYLIKPFDTLELLARIKVQLRQAGVASGESRKLIKIGNFEIDPSSYQINNNGMQINILTPREFDILYVLMKNFPNPVSREDIFQVIWDKSEKKYTRVIDIHVAKIRKKISPQEIKTIPGKGYLFPSQ